MKRCAFQTEIALGFATQRGSTAFSAACVIKRRFRAVHQLVGLIELRFHVAPGRAPRNAHGNADIVPSLPLPPETADAGYLYAVTHAVLPILEDFKPDIIINSAGQDNHFSDPLANMKLSAQGYAALNAALNPHIAVLEGGYSIRGALPYVNLGICLALAGLPADDIREPEWTPEAERQSDRVSEYIARLCDAVVELYRHPPTQPEEGREDHGWWVRNKHIFYDTDMLREGQTEAWRLCPDCSGLGRIETASERVARSLCLLIPRHACPRCREEGLRLAREAQRSGRYAHVLLLDGDDAAAGDRGDQES